MSRSPRAVIQRRRFNPPDDRLDSLGCGQGTPVADNANEDGKAQNRRVEFVIVRKRHPRGQCELYKPGEHHRRHDKDGKDSKDATPPAPARGAVN